MRCVDVVYSLAHTQRGIQGGCHVSIRKANSLLDEVIFYHLLFSIACNVLERTRDIVVPLCLNASFAQM